MNIKITYNWLRDYLDTNAKPHEIQKYLSLCGPSVERVERAGDDAVFDIEVTSNRVDTASVFGIAQECVAILPQFGKRARLKLDPLADHTIKKAGDALEAPKDKLPLKVSLKQRVLCPRFSAIVLSDVHVRNASDKMRNRLTLCGVRSIDNLVDVTNYIMLSLGQPAHIFDYDKIKDHKMILRESRKGEKLTTLDGKELLLRGGEIVIEDGSGQLIDLCGIMGAQNSAVGSATKNAVLFVQTYDKRLVRRASMQLGQRTMAASYFEKGLDPKRVENAIVYGVELLKEEAGVTVASELVDIYPKPYKQKSLSTSVEFIGSAMGIPVDPNTVTSILNRLGFRAEGKQKITVQIPSYRSDDVNIPEDIVEEVARIYGYFNLPSNIQTTKHLKQPAEIERTFLNEYKIRFLLKHIGLHETYNYSMISEGQIERLGLKKDNHLKLVNTISKDIEYLRTSLAPSLIKNLKDNEGKKDELRFFELAKVYNRKRGDLPEETRILGIATNTDFGDIKGVLESLFDELNVATYSFKPSKSARFLSPSMQAVVSIGSIGTAGYAGQLGERHRVQHELSHPVFLAELDAEALIVAVKSLPTYISINPYAVIKLDLTVEMKEGQTYQKLVEQMKRESKLLTRVRLVDMYRNKLTLRLYFSSTKRNITENEAKAELEKILLTLR